MQDLLAGFPRVPGAPRLTRPVCQSGIPPLSLAMRRTVTGARAAGGLPASTSRGLDCDL